MTPEQRDALNSALALLDSDIVIDAMTAAHIIRAVLDAETDRGADLRAIAGDAPVICIDPGHGEGYEPRGVVCNGVDEEVLVLKVGGWLCRKGDTMTRAVAECGVSLSTRVQFANDTDADCFVSLHVNSLPEDSPYRDTASGAIVFYEPGSTEGRRLAACIMARMMADSGASYRRKPGPDADDDGTIARSHYVTRNTKMPAVLVELGFATHKGDAEHMSEPGYPERAAECIRAGVMDWWEGRR